MKKGMHKMPNGKMMKNSAMKKKMPKLGTGERFRNLTTELAKKPGIKNPAALAATIGRKKYGKKKMSKLSMKGRMKFKGKTVY